MDSDTDLGREEGKPPQIRYVPANVEPEMPRGKNFGNPDIDKLSTPESKSKGGKTRSMYGELQRSLTSRKVCNHRCPMFDTCPLGVSAMAFTNPKTGEKGLCLMKQMTPNVQKQFINMFLTGEEGVIRAIKDAIHAYLTDVELYGTMKDKKELIDVLIRFYKEVYASPKNVQRTKAPLTITLRRVGFEPETLTIAPSEQLPEGIGIKQLRDPIHGDITEGDPESLMTSPILDTITRLEKRGAVFEELKIEGIAAEEEDEGEDDEE